jgi:hypothetical protein
MRKEFLLVCMIFLGGCAESLETYVNNPSEIVRDPHFKQYEQSLAGLESDYLNKKITYVEYVEKKKQMDDQYTQEVEERNDIINSSVE